MCGINGYNFKDDALIKRMNDLVSHRGPDAEGLWSEEGITLGHRRLSIIDTSESANQPMHSASGRYVIIFNGEIYNFKELREKLGNYAYRTTSDTEVILAAFEKWGTRALGKLNGIFAFALWDREKKELLLARDPAGVKPLYYFWDGARLIFSSELKAVLEYDMPRMVDEVAFSIYLRTLYVPSPLTMIKGIKKLEPGTYATLADGSFCIKKYTYEPGSQNRHLSFEETKEAVRDKVGQAVRRQLVSDRPLGLYLSGGIDSSIVLDRMAEVGAKIKTFSVGFDLGENEEREKFNADFKLAAKTAKAYGAAHNEVTLSYGDVEELLEKAIWHLDEPISNATILPMYKLSHFAKESVDVVLGGDGGDELFGGYERYRLSYLSDQYRKWMPNVVRKTINHKKLSKLNTPPGIERYALFHFQKDSSLEGVVKKDFIDEHAEEFFKEKYFSKIDGDFTSQFMEADRKTWLVDESLARSDRMSMSAGIEARVPLLDLELIDFSGAIPRNMKVDAWHTKHILKEAFKGHIPDYLLDQPKRGWFSPAAKWLRYPTIEKMAREILSSEYHSGTKSGFRWGGVEDMLSRHISKEEYNLTMLWSLITFQVWARKYKVTLE